PRSRLRAARGEARRLRCRHRAAQRLATTVDNKLKLSALDADDLGVISAAIQDSLVAVRDCAWFAGEKRFVLLLNRFRWEADPGVEAKYWRTHSALVFNQVNGVHHHRVPLKEPDRVLELLSVAAENDRSVTVRF